MESYKFEKREIRSFRLRKKTLDFNIFLKKENKVAWFLMADLIQPKDRAELKEIFQQYNLNLTFLSKKMITLWFQGKNLNFLKNLLTGNVIKIEPKLESTEITEKQIISILNYISTQKHFNLRFMLWNEEYYRKEKVNEYLIRNTNLENFKNIIPTTLLYAPLLEGSLFKELNLTKNHYKTLIENKK